MADPKPPNRRIDTKPFEARAWLAAIVDSSDDAIVSKSLDGTITSWNSAATQLFGYQPEEIIGTPVLRLIPPDLHYQEPQFIARVSRGERIDHFETVRMRKNGERFHVSLTISPIRDSSGVVVGASKIVRDISLQREADRLKSVLAAIIESSDDAIISKDLEGRVTSWNSSAARVYGFTAEEMIGQSIRSIIPPDLQHEEDEIIARIRAGNRIEHFETRRIRKNGGEVEVSITVSPIRDALGNVVGASKIARDITAQRDAQRRKDQFIAVLAHELRNPLAPVRNALTLIGRPGLTEMQRAKAHAIAERQVAHMARLLEDLLDVSRLSTGRVELRKEWVDLATVIDHALDATRALMEAKQHQLTVLRPPQPVALQADPVRLTQILVNLLSNAAKYTDRGGKLRLDAVALDGHAVISVSDNGIGFTPAMKEKLFMLFEQADDAVTRDGGGLGIGLALVREFVERHGGTVEAASSGPGQGSTFTVKLPL